MKSYWIWLSVMLCATLFSPIYSQSFKFTPKQNLTLEEKVNVLLGDLTKVDERGYGLLPNETRLVKLNQHLTTLAIYLDIPVLYLETEFDDLILDEIVEELVSPLSDYHIEEVALLAKNRTGDFVQLSKFLEQPIVSFDPMLSQNTEPIQSQKGVLNRKNINLHNNAQPRGQLTGKTIWLSAGHGWQYHPRFKTFHTQRHNTHGIVEDFASIEFVNYHLLKYLYQAGANVWTVRERDMNETEIIIDNDDGYPHYQEEGRWHTSRSKGYKNKTYRYTMTSARRSASATYQSVVPKSGRYWVSTRFRSGLNRTVDARYKIHHAGGVSETSINQEIHGDTWVYLGQFYFEAGEKVKIELLNGSTETGQALIADAVRLGGGKGDQADCRTGIRSGEPRYEEGAKYYAAFQGFPKCYNDVIVRPQYAEWELAKGSKEEQHNAIYLSIHTNGSGSTGTESYVHSFKPVRGSKILQQYVHGELIKDIRSGWDKNWKNRGQKAADFGELRGLRTMPGVLVELAFHDNPKDAVALTTPDFRDLTARAIYKGVVKYYAKKNRERAVFLPEPPTALSAVNDGDGRIRLSWQQGAYGGLYGSRAEGYKIYISRHGRAFADFELTNNNSFTFQNLEPNTSYFFRVSAVNKGGESFPTATVAVRTPDNNKASVRYLIVDGYDRLDRSQGHVVYESKPKFAPLGNVRRLPIDQMNDYSYAAEHANALAAAGIYFDGTDNNALTSRSIDLQFYDGVNWFLGRESVNDEVLSAKERALLTMYLQSGGKLIISGSEIGYDLEQKGSGRHFYRKYLKAKYMGDNAGSTRFIGRNALNFKGLNGNFESRNYPAYPVNSPDYIKPADGGETIMKYGNGKVAAIGYQREFGLLHFAFPLEMIADEQLRNEIFLRSLEYLHPPKIKDIPKLEKDIIADGRN